MPGLFVFALILVALSLIVGAVCIIAGVYGHKQDSEDAVATAVFTGILSFVFFIGGGLAIIFSSFNSVGTYDIGVTTSFGKVISYVGPGAHWIAPWENMVTIDESIQQTNDELTVRVAGQQTAVANVKLRWQIIPSATDVLFKQYKGSTANVGSALVIPELNVAMNSVYDGYDPILPLSTGAKAGTPDNPSTPPVTKAALFAAS